MDKEATRRYVAKIVGPATFRPLIERLPPERPLSPRSWQVAHWASSLAEATPEPRTEAYDAPDAGCLYPRDCDVWRTCWLVLRRARSISTAREALARARREVTEYPQV